MSTIGARSTLGVPRAIADAGTRVLRDRSEERRLSEAVSRHFAVVWRSLRRFGVPEGAADDAAQHVFMTFAARLSSVDAEHERAFLASTAVRVAANVRRQLERARETPLADIETEPAAEGTPEELLEEKRRRAALDEALGALPFDQRTVFVLFELEGFTLPEIARSLEVPLGTATSRLLRARRRFEDWIHSRQPKVEEP
ncbi:MAG TPA: sigma-70 family RNA polymerase sigma factor [Polyangiaceae bacterium]